MFNFDFFQDRDIQSKCECSEKRDMTKSVIKSQASQIISVINSIQQNETIPDEVVEYLDNQFWIKIMFYNMVGASELTSSMLNTCKEDLIDCMVRALFVIGEGYFDFHYVLEDRNPRLYINFDF